MLSQEVMPTSHVALATVHLSGTHVPGSGASMFVGAELQTVLVHPGLLHPSFSAWFNWQHCLALALTGTWEPLVASAPPREVGW